MSRVKANALITMSYNGTSELSVQTNDQTVLVLSQPAVRMLIDEKMPHEDEATPADLGRLTVKKPTGEKQDDALVFRVAALFIEEGMKPKDIADHINKDSTGGFRLTRASIYPLLNRARAKKFLRLVAPLEEALADQVAGRFGCLGESIRVVNTDDPKLNTYVSAAAAEVAWELAKELNRRRGRNPVSLGLGPGGATLDFSRHLSELISSDPAMPSGLKLKLFAITAGCPPRLPQVAPVSFFNLFPSNIVGETVGLFAETMVPARETERIKTRPGAREAFEAKGEIDLVITSMGDFEDEHDWLRQFLIEAGTDTTRWKAVGNVQYRPYSDTAAIKETLREMRVVTLFELSELVKLSAQKDKEVILIARQCRDCGKSRARALRPLLTHPDLKVFSRLVMDAATARELLERP